MWVPTLGRGVLDEDKKLELKKEQFELSHLIVWIALWIVNTCSEFQENIFSNNKRYYKMSKFLYTATADDEAKAIAIPQVFSENRQGRNLRKFQKKKILVYKPTVKVY